MNSVQYVLLALTMAAATALLLVVARYVAAITNTLAEFGTKPGCNLEKIAQGLIQIDRDTTIIAPGVTELNLILQSIREGLQSIDRFLVAIVRAQV